MVVVSPAEGRVISEGGVTANGAGGDSLAGIDCLQRKTSQSPAAIMSRPPSRTRIGELAQILGDAELEVMATDDVHWDRIASVELVGEVPVYDATVLGLHNFIVNQIPLHNSLEQDADMVILLHREDLYERESTRPGEADLIVAKHRNGPTRDITVAFQGHYSRFVDMAH